MSSREPHWMTVSQLAMGGVLLVLLATACGGTDTIVNTEASITTAASTPTTLPPTTTTTVPPTTTTTLDEQEFAAIQYEEDVKAIKKLWRRFSDSWSAGSEAGYQYITDYNHPLEECTGLDWKEWKRITDQDHSLEVVVDATTIERDDGWPMPSGPNAGAVPDGRIYIMSAVLTEWIDNNDPNVATLEIHSLVDADGSAFFFFGCRDS